jgi:hypothetical protein
MGVGKQLIEEFIGQLCQSRGTKLNTLVEWNDWHLIRLLDQ